MMMMMMMTMTMRRRRRGRGKQKGGSVDVDGDDDDDNEKTFQWVDVYIGEMFVAEDRPGDTKFTSQQGGEELPPPCGGYLHSAKTYDKLPSAKRNTE
jgi:hypothetical protein